MVAVVRVVAVVVAAQLVAVAAVPVLAAVALLVGIAALIAVASVRSVVAVAIAAEVMAVAVVVEVELEIVVKWVIQARAHRSRSGALSPSVSRRRSCRCWNKVKEDSSIINIKYSFPLKRISL